MLIINRYIKMYGKNETNKETTKGEEERWKKSRRFWVHTCDTIVSFIQESEILQPVTPAANIAD